MFYVSIDGIDDDTLAFLGYVCVAEDDQFKLYRDYHGEEYVVDKARPRLFIEDPNDAQIIASRSRSGEAIVAPS